MRTHQLTGLGIALTIATALGACSATIRHSETRARVGDIMTVKVGSGARSTTTSPPTGPRGSREHATAVTASGHLTATIEIFRLMSEATGGVHVRSESAAQVPHTIEQVLDRAIPTGQPVDLVFVVDTTGSMKDDIDAVRSEMRTILARLTRTNPDRRVGVVGYRDRNDEYLTWTFLQLDANEEAIIGAIESLKVAGGGDRREHVYAGLGTALSFQPWRPQASQHIVLMGDAPPHENLGGVDTRESVLTQARTAPRNVAIHTIGLRCDDCTAVLAERADKR